MPHIMDVDVNEALADPETEVTPPVDERLKEVMDGGWDVRCEETQYGSYRRQGTGWIVPTRDITGKILERRIDVITPGASIDDAFSEVSIFSSNSEPKRCFLVKNEEPNPITKRINWSLLIFTPPKPQEQ